jgi:hypothetical protein
VSFSGNQWMQGSPGTYAAYRHSKEIGGCAMLYTVEVRLHRDAFLARMSEMRVWLDRQGYEPDLFQYYTERNGTARLRVDFK